MGKYRSSVRKEDSRVEGQLPIWRGIGCLLIVLVPVLAYAAADVTMPFFQSRGLVPRELLTTPQTPDWLWIAPVLAQIYQFLFVRHGILAILVLTVIYILFIGGIMSVLYAFMYQLAAPSRYGPMDAPPPRVKVKKYKR
jgi:hypothetical protein